MIFDASFNSFGTGPPKPIKRKPVLITNKMPKAEKERIMKEQALLPKFEAYSLVAHKLGKAL